MTENNDTTNDTDGIDESKNEDVDGDWLDEDDDRQLFSEAVKSDSGGDRNNSGTDSGRGDVRAWLVDHKKTVAGVAAGLGLVMALAVLWVAPPLWRYGLLAFGLGILPGVTLFPWITSPFGPGLWVLSAPFARIHLTISQVIRKVGILVKRSSNDYELGTYVPDDGEAVVSDGRVSIDEASTRWGLFGKRRLGLTWEFGTDVYERITVGKSTSCGQPEQARGVAAESARSAGEAVADGRGSTVVSLDAAHRLFRGVNEADTITRTKEHAEAEYGGGEEDLGGLTMALLVVLMLLLGSGTTWLML